MAKSLADLENPSRKKKEKKPFARDDDKEGKKTKVAIEEEIFETTTLSEGDQVQSVNAPQISDAKNQLSIAVRTVEEDEYLDNAEITPIVPSISKARSTTPVPIVTEANVKKEEAKDDEELEIPDTCVDLGGDDDDNDDDDNDDDDDDFFIHHTPSTTVKRISINEP
ncbi:hypothetical protein L6452_26136 [Arctium lappa]|uniref:Uncharacterized protein n=1 Tax=Arctium lappa TaxID=4217 RepID=A0ACB9AC54_ARCLA|nr:hypothetical protein L6452_26136 [Arctium lappa]